MQKDRERFKISYIKKPFARKSFYCIGLAAVALILGGVSLFISVRNQGQAGLNAGALGFCSLLIGAFSVGYGALSFWEREKNYILSKIGLFMGGSLVVFWVCMIVIGLRG